MAHGCRRRRARRPGRDPLRLGLRADLQHVRGLGRRGLHDRLPEQLRRRQRALRRGLQPVRARLLHARRRGDEAARDRLRQRGCPLGQPLPVAGLDRADRGHAAAADPQRRDRRGRDADRLLRPLGGRQRAAAPRGDDRVPSGGDGHRRRPPAPGPRPGGDGRARPVLRRTRLGEDQRRRPGRDLDPVRVRAHQPLAAAGRGPALGGDRPVRTGPVRPHARPPRRGEHPALGADRGRRGDRALPDRGLAGRGEPAVAARPCLAARRRRGDARDRHADPDRTRDQPGRADRRLADPPG